MTADLLRMLAHRARCFPNYPMGYHMPEVFAALGEQPPEPSTAEGDELTDAQLDAAMPGPEQFETPAAPWTPRDRLILRAAMRAGAALVAKPQPKGTPAGYVTAIEEGKVLMMPRPSLDTAGLVPVYAAAQAPAPAQALGWKLTPSEATPQMLTAAGWGADSASGAAMWRDMHAAAPCAAVTHAPLPKGWTFNHAQQQKDEDGPVDGVWEIGFLDPEDDRFSPIVTVDTGLYYQDKQAEPLARAILARLTDSLVPVQGNDQ